MTISAEFAAGAAILERGAESIRAVTRSEDNRFTRVFAALQALANATGTPIAIVEGIAAIRYGYPAITEDIDIVIAQERLQSVLIDAPQHGFKVQWRSKTGWLSLAFEDVEINVVPEGGKARDTAPTTIPGPVALGVPQGLDYASLPGWVELKLSSARAKDRTQVIEVLKRTSPEQIAEIVRFIERVHATYAELLAQLIAEADAEKRQESDRGKRP